MRFSARSKVGIILSAVTILAVVSGFLVMAISSRGTPTHAASRNLKTYHIGKVHQAARTSSEHSLPKGPGTTFTRQQSFSSHPEKNARPLGGVPAKGIKPKALKAHAPSPAAGDNLGVLRGKTAEGGVLQNFLGATDLSSDGLNGFAVTPPDQGLCTGIDPTQPGDPQVVFEMVNLEVRETDVTGNPFNSLGNPFPDVNLTTFFNDPFAGGDPRCLYDKSTATFFFTDFSSDFATFSGVDLAVLNENGAAFYFFPTDGGCGCFGDQPLIGLDNSFVFLSTNEFGLFGADGFVGALITVISKADLVALSPFVFNGTFPIVGSVNGLPAFTIQPADSVSKTHTEYFLESFPFDLAGNPNTIDRTVAQWSAPGDDIDTITLNLDALIGTEVYAFPVVAASTGSGAVVDTICTGIGGTPPCFPITSEAFLNPDDDRMQQVEAIRDTNGHIDLWADVSSAVSFAGDPVTYDGSAWFKIDATSASLIQDGYVASQGNWLLYPAIEHTFEGSTTMVFTITNSQRDPSAAYTTRKSGNRHFGGIVTTGEGLDAHESFSDAPPFNQARWGDYSAATLDLNGNDVWMATEFIPPQSFQDVFDNWGTLVFEVMGDH